MVELALLAEEGLEASPHELTLGRPAYTIETLEHFRRERPEAELYLLMGEDSFVELNHWVRYREIPGVARLVVLARPGWDYLSADLPPELREIAASGQVTFLEQEQVDVSSTRIREALRAGLSPCGDLPDLVIRYLKYPFMMTAEPNPSSPDTASASARPSPPPKTGRR
jgi:nicotinate-nucleotide adenylyltransferase